MNTAELKRLAVAVATTFRDEFPGQEPDVIWLARAARVGCVPDEQRGAFFEEVRAALEPPVARSAGRKTAHIKAHEVPEGHELHDLGHALNALDCDFYMLQVMPADERKEWLLRHVRDANAVLRAADALLGAMS